MTETHGFNVALRGKNRDVYEHTVKNKPFMVSFHSAVP
jgi:hypothetical protein